MFARTWFSLGFAAALITAVGCGGGDNGGGGGTPAPAIACTDGGVPAANVVALRCGGATSNTVEDVKVVISGPASGSTSLRGLNFDVTFDATKLTFTPAGSYTSPLFPGALIAVASPTAGRVVVSIQVVGGNLDVAVATGQHDVLTLSFARASGVNFAPTPLTFENAEATSPSAPITFAGGLALSYQ